MATQFDPIAKDESLNTTESPSRNVADVLAQGLDAIEQAIAGGSGSGGHTIVNASGTDMTQRAKMQFVDAEVTDDAVNDVTKISTTPASYPSSNVTYGSGSVEDALDDLIRGSVSVTADGVKTYGQLLNELYALTDTSKLGRFSIITMDGEVYCANRTESIYEFIFFNLTKQSPYIHSYRLRLSNNSEYVAFNSTGYDDITSVVLASGVKITLYY